MKLVRNEFGDLELASCRVAAAVIGAAVVGAAATTAASSSASSATRDATNASIAQQQSALGQQATLSAPYRALGESAIPTLKGLLGIGGADPTKTLQNTPGYQFAKSEGLGATKNAATASGMALSGNTLEALDKFSTGLADQTYQQQVGNFESVTGMGQAAAAGQAQNVGNAAANTSSLIMNQGNTLAGIRANEAAGLTGVIGNATDQWTTMNTLKGLQNQPVMDNSATFADPSGSGFTYNLGGG